MRKITTLFISRIFDEDMDMILKASTIQYFCILLHHSAIEIVLLLGCNCSRTSASILSQQIM